MALLDRLVDGAGGIDGMVAPSAIAIMPDNRHFFVASHYDQTITAFERDPKNAEVLHLGTYWIGIDFEGPKNVNSLWAAPTGDELLACGGALVGFSVGPDGKLTQEWKIDSDDDDSGFFLCEEISGTAAGDLVAMITYLDQIRLYARSGADAKPSLLSVTTSAELVGSDAYAPAAAVLSPDGKHIYMCPEAKTIQPIGHILGYSIEPGSGELQLTADTEVSPIHSEDMWVDSLAFQPDGKTLYAATSEGMILVFFRDPSDGQLEELQSVAVCGEASQSGSGTIVKDLSVSATGSEVLVTAVCWISPFESLLLSYPVDAQNGQLLEPHKSVIEGWDAFWLVAESNGGEIAIAPSREWFAVTSMHYPVHTMPQPVAVGALQDDGAPHLQEQISHGEGGAGGLLSVSSVLAVPSGYVFGLTDATYQAGLSVLSVEADTGRIHLLDHLDLSGWEGKSRLMVRGPTDDSVFVLGCCEDSKPFYGMVELEQGQVLSGPAAPAVLPIPAESGKNPVAFPNATSPPGSILYLVSGGELFVLSADAGSGSLTNAQDVGGFALPGAIDDIAAAADGEHLYLAGGSDCRDQWCNNGGLAVCTLSADGLVESCGSALSTQTGGTPQLPAWEHRELVVSPDGLSIGVYPSGCGDQEDCSAHMLHRDSTTGLLEGPIVRAGGDLDWSSFPVVAFAGPRQSMVAVYASLLSSGPIRRFVYEEDVGGFDSPTLLMGGKDGIPEPGRSGVVSTDGSLLIMADEFASAVNVFGIWQCQ